ncbi:MAG: hypothetical protein MJB14_23545 [Spirochaetes bacterium]|nr:hypothetical protein [Spirochaetota bacterium]
MINKNPIIVFNRKRSILFYVSLLLILLFVISTISIFLITGRFNFYTFFYLNIKEHLFRMIASGFYVSLLAFGIFFLIVSLFNEMKQIFCYEDRIELKQVLQKTIIIPYQEISSINFKIFYLHQNGKNFNQYQQKECRVLFNNQKFTFYLSYGISGYYDEIEPVKSQSVFLFPKIKLVQKEQVDQVIKLIQNVNKISTPYLPEEVIL